MKRLLPLTVYCISLVSLRQLLAAPAEDRLPGGGGVRSNFLSKLLGQVEGSALMSDSPPNAPAPPSPAPTWPPGFLRRRPTSDAPAPSPARLTEAPGPRVRRHAHPRGAGHHAHQRGGGHHAQLMRVGCVLGTCQVQNLSHRLYQLMGQSGREDSSPINPRSPHSYG